MHAYTLFCIVEGIEKRQSGPSGDEFLSCQHFVVWSHWQGDAMPYFTLWISEDSEPRSAWFLPRRGPSGSYYLCVADFNLWGWSSERTDLLVSASTNHCMMSVFLLWGGLIMLSLSFSWPLWFCDCAMHNWMVLAKVHAHSPSQNKWSVSSEAPGSFIPHHQSPFHHFVVLHSGQYGFV